MNFTTFVAVVTFSALMMSLPLLPKTPECAGRFGATVEGRGKTRGRGYLHLCAGRDDAVAQDDGIGRVQVDLLHVLQHRGRKRDLPGSEKRAEREHVGACAAVDLVGRGNRQS